MELVADPSDLAPGDARSASFDLGQIEPSVICDPGDPLFSLAYETLHAEFGPKHEIETRDVLDRRLRWDPAPVGGFSLFYEMILALTSPVAGVSDPGPPPSPVAGVSDPGPSTPRVAAVRDFTVIVSDRAAVVHLSHVLVLPAWRRTGLAGWLRAWPVQRARSCLAGRELPITLVGEMEHPSPDHPERFVRLKAYEKAGFLKIDPSAIDYLQPDFRPPAEIDASGGSSPLPFALIVRRVGREAETTIPAAELRHLVECLYHMYGREFRTQEMTAVQPVLDRLPPRGTPVALVPPTA